MNHFRIGSVCVLPIFGGFIVKHRVSLGSPKLTAYIYHNTDEDFDCRIQRIARHIVQFLCSDSVFFLFAFLSIASSAPQRATMSNQNAPLSE